MPTGYTAEIANDISFEQFVLTCARAMNALIVMRDEPMSTPIPERFEPADYYASLAAEAEKELQALQAMSMQEVYLANGTEYCEACDRHRQAIQDQATLRAKYSAMREKVNAWEPVAKDHERLKEFMLSQLEDSIRADCSTLGMKEPVPLLPAEWLSRKLAEHSGALARYREEHAKEIARTNATNEWVRLLRESLRPAQTAPEVQ